MKQSVCVLMCWVLVPVFHLVWDVGGGCLLSTAICAKLAVASQDSPVPAPIPLDIGTLGFTDS